MPSSFQLVCASWALFFTVVASQKPLTACPATATSISTTSGAVYEICPNADFQTPSMLIQGNIPDPVSCLKLCDTTAGCQKAVYDNKYAICHIKGNPSPFYWVTSSQYSTIRVASRLTTGTAVSSCPVTEIKQTLPDGRTSVICPGTDFQVPSFLIQGGIPSDTSCATLCGQNSQCSRAVYDRVNSVCHLKGGADTTSWVQNAQYETIRIVGAGSGPGSTTTSIPSSPSIVPAPTGRSLTPIMGYNSYNDVGCSPSNDQINSTILAMSTKGFVNAGYRYFQIDCGWQGYQRLSNGSITYDSNRFPYGIAPLSKFAISLGHIWSMYTTQGVYSCDTSYDPHRPGSVGYESQDAAMFAAWNVQYLKVDNCFVDPNDNAPKAPLSDFPTRYGAMWRALKAFNIPNMLICQWGVPYLNQSTNTLQGPDAWTPPISTSFRVSDDIVQGWGHVFRIYNQAIHACLLNLFGPGNSIDMDLLEVGNPGMTFDEQKSHFAIWATFKSALMISTNVPQMSTQTASILGNRDLIAVNQDSLGKPVKLIQRFTNDYDLFLGPLANGDQVLLAVDQSNNARSLNINFADVGINSANVKDLWTGQSLGSLSSLSQAIAAHGSIVLRLSSVQQSNAPAPQLQPFPAAAGALAGGAYTAPCSTCTNGQKVGGITAGSSASLTFSNIRTSQSTTDVRFDYINCEVQYMGYSMPNVRAASISVNGNAPVTVLFPLTGYNWSGDRLTNFKVRLSGFSTTGTNTIAIRPAAGQGDAPDFDRMLVPS